jgi:hypothetical protein
MEEAHDVVTAYMEGAIEDAHGNTQSNVVHVYEYTC